MGIPWSSAEYKFQLAPLNKMTTCLVTFFIRLILNILFLVDLPRNSWSFEYERLLHMCKGLLLSISVVDGSNCWLSSCAVLCFQGSKVQTRVGLLMLLCTWISNCPIAVTHFLHNQENVPFVSLKKLPFMPKPPAPSHRVRADHMTLSFNQPWLCDLSSWRRRSQRTWEKMRGWSRVCAHCFWESASITMTTHWKTTPSKSHLTHLHWIGRNGLSLLDQCSFNLPRRPFRLFQQLFCNKYVVMHCCLLGVLKLDGIFFDSFRFIYVSVWQRA